jgi:hypothetical protein
MFKVDIRNTQIPAEKLIKPSIIIQMNPEFSGNWVVGGDLTGDGKLEFVSARNDDQVVTTAIAYDLEGKTLWTWGEANSGGAKLTYDVPLQAYDITGDGKDEIFLSTKTHIVMLNGETGKEFKRFKLPKGLNGSDSIAFANLSGNSLATDIIIKSRYRKVWAYTKDWNLLWVWEPPSRKTCHYPTIVDWNQDGRDNVLAGKPFLDHLGQKMFNISTKKTGRRGHLDAQRVFNTGEKKEDIKLIYTYCGGLTISCIDYKGKLLWQDTGHHFESIDVGTFNPDYPSPQFYIDIDHKQFGESLGFFYDITGKKFGTVQLNYGRQHRHIDWTGDGIDEVVIINELLIINGKGEAVAGLEYNHGDEIMQPSQKEKITYIHNGILDVSGKGNGDIVMYSEKTICIYLNPNENSKKHTRIERVNFTFY